MLFRTVTLKTWGGRDVNITAKNVRNLLEAVVLKGIVKNIKGMGVPDLISAPAMAREAGIESVISTVSYNLSVGAYLSSSSPGHEKYHY